MKIHWCSITWSLWKINDIIVLVARDLPIENSTESGTKDVMIVSIMSDPITMSWWTSRTFQGYTAALHTMSWAASGAGWGPKLTSLWVNRLVIHSMTSNDSTGPLALYCVTTIFPLPFFALCTQETYRAKEWPRIKGTSVNLVVVKPAYIHWWNNIRVLSFITGLDSFF